MIQVFCKVPFRKLIFLKLSLFAALLPAIDADAQEVRIGVLGLFHPHQLTLRPSAAQALVIQAGSENFILERSSGQDTATITLSGDRLILRVGNRQVQVSAVRAVGRGNDAADFTLAIPGKISRVYLGVLEVNCAQGVLVPVVRMDLETAVASVVAAESDSDSPLEALKAQAVATRSFFLAAQGRHHNFDFCDTTHCQFLRAPPPLDSNSWQAALATRGLVLAYADRPVAAMFARSCGGRTRTPQDVGLPGRGYPYFPVVCDYCLRNPWRWTRRVSQAEAADLARRGEASRLEIDRRTGWDAVPSNNFTARSDGKDVILQGAGQGHGIGLCQHGAKAMAQTGSSFREILAHYYPNTTLARAEQRSDQSASGLWEKKYRGVLATAP
ncbi:MAG: SpoIID/LytB domain-containing protein [Terriglobales bacterium]